MKLVARAVSMLAAALLTAGPAAADDATDEFERLRVVGSAANAHAAAGSAHLIGRDALARFDYTDAHRVLRQVPGVYLVDEEGFGLRPNIGMRGSGTDRSSRITLLEDGVLVAPAPYAAPAAYYFPTVARMDAVEVRKGSVSVSQGPYTTGGAINFISTPIPDLFSAQLRAYAGSFGTSLVHGRVGDREGSVGWLVEAVQQRSDGFKDLDGGGDTGYSTRDFLAKLSWELGGPLDQVFELKLGAVEHDSDETYLGLTADDFAATPLRRYAASQRDRMDTSHRQYQLRHRARTDRFEFTTVAYRNDFARAWYKLQSVGGVGLSTVLLDPTAHADEFDWLRGTTSPDDALVIRNNNRAYYAHGLQHITAWSAGSDAVAHDFELGVRVHADEEDRFQNDDAYRMDDGRLVLTGAGAPGSQTNRVGAADVVAVYFEDEIAAGAWRVTPGVRYERIETTRTDYALTDPDRAAGPTGIREATHTVWIPGIGASYAAGDATVLFASAHRGFTPPGPGSDADAETSVNYELGLRHLRGPFSAELVGFVNDYSNLVGTCTASTGGGCAIGDQFDGGEVAMRGVELGARFVAGGDAVRIPLTASATLTDAEFESSFTSAFGEFGTVTRGDELPYLPRMQWQLGVGVESARARVHLTGTWVDEMRTVAGSGRPPREQRTDEYLVVDVAAAWTVRSGFDVFGKVENLLDDEYIVAWRPAGARPGKPRAVTAGVRVAF